MNPEESKITERPGPPGPSQITSSSENPRAVIGGNFPPVPIPADIRERLKGEFADMLAGIQSNAELCKARTRTLGSDDELKAASDAFKELRGDRAKWEGVRVAQKEPYLAGERAVDGYFVPVRDRIDEILSSLEAECGGYLRRKEAEERARKEAEARRLREEEERRRLEADRLRREQEEAQRKANEAQRARDRQRAQDEADRLARERNIADASADAVGSMASSAEEKADSKPADLARTRGEQSLSTLAESWQFEVTDWDAIKFDGPLRPFIPRDAIEKAVRAYVKVHKSASALEGVRVFQGRKVNIR